jgi:hypothetical protein
VVFEENKSVKRHLLAGLLFCDLVLSGCVMQPVRPLAPPSGQDRAAKSVDVAKPAQPAPDNGIALAAARRVCAAQYPATVGTFRARATCVNEAIDRFALSDAINPDLIRLQQSARIALSTKLDDRAISQKEAEAIMAEIDAKVVSVERYRAISDHAAAESQLAILNDLVVSVN